MNINRLLSRREKDGSSHKREKSRDKSRDRKSFRSHTMTSLSAAFSNPNGKGRPHLRTTFSPIHTSSADSRPGFTLHTRPLSSDGIIALFKPDPQKKQDKEQNAKIQALKQRLTNDGRTGVEDAQISYALSSKHADGDLDRAYEMVVLFQESVDGVIKPCNPDIQMKGAENREGFTCYLDALLFAMFARLGSFEPILYTKFDDEPRRRLSTLIRLWVNMLRTGKLIQTDVTQHLQEAIAACGWKDGGKLEQQDTSEAFSFITDKLQLPLLTLKMDIFHTGKEVPTDDHKFINERLLEVAVPEASSTDSRPVQLEDCLENYFNNRVEVVRHLERSNTVTSVRSAPSPGPDKTSWQQVEIKELSRITPDTPTSAQEPGTPLTPASGRGRATSIIRRRVIEEDEKGEPSDSDVLSTHNSVRKGSIRKEVLIPAWQFFNLIRLSPISSHIEPSCFSCRPERPVLIGNLAWYTNKGQPTNDAEVAAHFSQTRPVLGICLKRYAMTMSGQATRQDTFIDIPLDIRLPHFVEDEMDRVAPLMGNFKLSLQSVICHRGTSVNSGHYISFVRDKTKAADGDAASTRRLSNHNRPPHYPEEDKWIKFDDISQPDRVTYVDIEQALKDEMPYLLFYQVQPIYTISPPPGLEPPSYTHSGIEMRVPRPSPPTGNNNHLQPGYFEGAQADHGRPVVRISTDIDRPRRSINLPESREEIQEDRRGSVANTENSVESGTSFPASTEQTSAPATPIEETTAQRMSRAAARFTKSANRSRASSQTGENRLSSTFARIVTMRSKEALNDSKADPSKDGFVTNGVDSTADSSGVDDTASKIDDDTTPRKTSKWGNKVDKSKPGLEKGEIGTQPHTHHHHTLSRSKGKEKEVPDRECKVM